MKEDAFDQKLLEVGDETALDGKVQLCFIDSESKPCMVGDGGCPLRVIALGTWDVSFTSTGDTKHGYFVHTDDLRDHITRVSRPVDGNMVQLWPVPEPKYEVGQSVDTTCSTRIPVCWPATVLGAEWRDGRHWYSLKYPAGTKCGFIWDEPCLFLAPEPCPFKEGDVLVLIGYYRTSPVIETRFHNGAWELRFGDEPQRQDLESGWVSASSYELAPEQEWTPKVGEWVDADGSDGMVRAMAGDELYRVFLVNGPVAGSTVTFELAHLKPHTPPVSEVATVIDEMTIPGLAHADAYHIAEAICDQCQVILIERDAG